MTRSLVVAAVLLGSLLGSNSLAQLKFYYDPATGNVAFDTIGTPLNAITIYGMLLNPEIANFTFRTENYLPITQTFFVDRHPDQIGEGSLSTEISGYYTIGDVLPPGLSADQWQALNWTEHQLDSTYINYHRDIPNRDEVPGWLFYSYVVEVGGLRGPRSGTAADFIYGQPDRPFDNRWDLVNPDTLDWATGATLVYDPATGNVTIDTARGEAGGHISWFILQSDGAFLPENFTPWITAPFTTKTPNVIGFAADAIEPGVYSAGQILPAGLTLDELRSTFTSAKFVARAGFGGASFDLETDGLNFGFALATLNPFDFNSDGVVDLLDLDILGANWGRRGAPGLPGDANQDGVVDLLDMDGMRFTDSPPWPYAAVPEPVSAVMCSLALAALPPRRR